jgi:hypothetical protein
LPACTPPQLILNHCFDPNNPPDPLEERDLVRSGRRRLFKFSAGGAVAGSSSGVEPSVHVGESEKPRLALDPERVHFIDAASEAGI